MSVTIHQGSILDSTADAIVNPANSHLRHGGGLARIIADAATREFKAPANYSVPADSGRSPVKELRAMQRDHEMRAMQWREDHRYAPLVPTGGAHATSPGVLDFRAVIHAVGPVWGGGRYFERQLLGAAHDSSIGIAVESGYGSIAIPAISCGIFGFPVEEAATIAVEAAFDWTNNAGIQVEFWLFEDAHFAAYMAAVQDYTS
jgi:O-acetyl-ADP-ribose deacetylase (regulator of RNase III)